MKYVLMIYQGPTPTLPGSDRWKALPEAEQKAIYADYAATTSAAGVAPGLPLGLPNAVRTVQVTDGKPQVKNGTYMAEGVGGHGFPGFIDILARALAAPTTPPSSRISSGCSLRPMRPRRKTALRELRHTTL